MNPGSRAGRGLSMMRSFWASLPAAVLTRMYSACKRTSGPYDLGGRGWKSRAVVVNRLFWSFVLEQNCL